ncbi:MAG TPA: hypothetical protein DDW67_02710 [Elusimicrobia bacterium]|nr:hypothetical protein [Elusimicrobiota bacterium]
MSDKPAKGGRLSSLALRGLDIMLASLSAMLNDPSVPFPPKAKKEMLERFAAIRENLGRDAERRGNKK